MNQVLDASRKVQREQNKFLAAIQGIDIDKGKAADSSFEDVKRRAEAKLRGMSEEQLEFADVGISIEVEDE